MTTPRNLGSILDLATDPDKPLFIDWDFDGRETIYTQGRIAALADGVARGLMRRGIARGERVGILSANRAEYVATVLGAMRAGIVPVPINTKFPRDTIRFILEDSAVRLLICDGERLASSHDIAPAIPTCDFDGAGDGGFAALVDQGPFEAILPGDDEAALILYTSGSTGRPKGVRLSHASHIWAATVRMEDYALFDETVLIAAPLYHMNALSLAFLVCASGATAVLLPQFRARHYVEAIGRYGCTWLTAVPPMIAMVMHEKAALAQNDISSVQTIRMGSAPVNDKMLTDLRALFPRARIINSYGTTEGGPIVFVPHPGGLAPPPGAVGVAHPDVSLRLSGPDAPDEGVLEMDSPAKMLGYLNRPEVRPFTDDGYYVTGDVFRRDANGFYGFVGREDDMFVSGAENIFPGEVEEVIERHPGVAQACVVPVPDEVKGTKPVAFVVARKDAKLDEAEVQRFVLDHAPAYQYPRRVWFLDQMVLAATNKVDRTALRQRAEAAIRDGSPA